MNLLTLNGSTLELLECHRDPNAVFASTAINLGNDRFAVPVSDDVIAWLGQIRFAGETDDDLIRRVIEFRDGGGRQ